MSFDHVRFRRLAAGLLLIVGPLLQGIAVLVDPGTWGDDREAVSFGDNPALAQLQSALYHWSWLLSALAVIGLMHLLRRSHPRLGSIFGSIVAVGYISASALLMTDPVEWWLGQHYAPERAQQILDEMLNLPGFVVAFQLPAFVSWFGGLPLLLLLVWRSGFVGWWVAAVTFVGYVGSMFAEYGPVTAVLWQLPVVAVGYVGLKVLRMSDEDWASYYAPGRTTPASYAKTTA